MLRDWNLLIKKKKEEARCARFARAARTKIKGCFEAKTNTFHVSLLWERHRNQHRKTQKTQAATSKNSENIDP